MHNLSEQPRELAISLLRVKRKGIRFSKTVKSGDEIIIYGCDALGQEVFNTIRDDLKVIAFIDKTFAGRNYEGIPIYAYDAPETYELLNRQQTVVFVTPMAYWYEIYSSLKSIQSSVRIYPIYALFALAENDMTTKKGKLLQVVAEREKSDISEIAVITTVYSLLLYLLLRPDFENVVFILGEGFPVDILKRFSAMTDYVYGGERFTGESDMTNDIANLFAIYAAEFDLQIWGHDHVVPAYSFSKKQFHVIEDGVANYKKRYAEYWTKVLDDGTVYVPMGYGGMVKEVFLTGKSSIPDEINAHVEVIDPSKLWSELNAEKKEELIELFSYPYNKILSMNAEGRSIVFLTEPFYDYNIMSEYEQIDLCKKVLSNYDMTKIIIKPHPGDKICYEEFMPECCVLREKFPFELFIWDRDVYCDKYIVLSQSNGIDRSFIANLVEREYIDCYNLEGLLIRSEN